MAMQQSGKGAGDSDARAASSALSDEQAEEFAASFTPAWDTGQTGDDSSVPANATLVDAPALAAADAAAVVQAIAQSAPAPAFHPKQTLIGTAPQANAPVTGAKSGPEMRAAASSAEAIDAENILDSSTAPPPPVRAAAPAPPPAPTAAAARPQTSLKGTQIMSNSPAQMDARKAQSRPPPAQPAAKNAVAVSADPFAAPARSRPSGRARPQSDELDDFVPKKSSKMVYLVLAGLVFAGGLGLFLKFALSDDPKPAPVEQHTTGPAVTTAEIPPPPPRVDTPPAPLPTAAATTVAKVEAQPPPATLPAPVAAPQPVRPADPPGHVAAAPQQPRQHVTPPQPQAIAAPQTPPASPKTPPKPANGSIVRDNPF